MWVRSLNPNRVEPQAAWAVKTRIPSLIAIVASVAATLTGAGSLAATSANYQSALGMNLMPVAYYSTEQPFLNIFKTAGPSLSNPAGWVTHSSKTWDTQEEQYLQLDANGYPTTLTAKSSDPHSPQQFDSVGVLLLRGLPRANAGTGMIYPAGQYVVLYDGQGTLSYGFDAVLVSSAPGRDVLNVATPTTGGGMELRITSTDPSHTGNYIRNIRVVKAEQEGLLDAGGIFNPKFVGLFANFRALRGMQWLNSDSAGGSLVSWSQRPHLTDAGYGGVYGTPIESVVQLCNAVGADCWLNVPHMANNDYISQMAALVHGMLGSSQKAYIEYSNEVWNGAYPQNKYAAEQGQAMWPGASANDARLSWYGMRSAQTCDIWKAAWGSDASRVICVMAGQAAQVYTATQELSCPLWTGAGNAPCASHGIGAVAMAPYFGYGIPVDPSWTTASDGGLAKIFEWINSSGLAQPATWESEYKTGLAPYNLPFIAYEGGQSLESFPQYGSNSPVTSLYINANRDARMGAAYTVALNNWRSAGGQLYVLFSDIAGPSVYGEWGALESVYDTITPLSSAPPKWRAIQNFMTNNNCWWAGCQGTIGNSTPPTPMPPTNLIVK
jgi:hypothetical protein